MTIAQILILLTIGLMGGIISGSMGVGGGLISKTDVRYIYNFSRT